MKTFKQFNSIENSYRQKFLEYIVQEGYSDGDWWVQEKIHGSNFSVWWVDGEIKLGKKSCFLQGEEGHFGARKWFLENQASFKALFEHLAARVGSTTGPRAGKTPQVVGVYGEVFGGCYDHPDVEAVSDAKRIQKGICYCPQIECLFFDIVVDGEYQSVSDVQILGDMFGIPTVENMYKGSFTECLAHGDMFITTIPKRFGLPTLEGNIGEGIVIRPEFNKFLEGGSRVILKKKNAKHAEKTEEKVKKVRELTVGEQSMYDGMVQYVTENRLRNVLSHLGEVTNKDFGKIMKAFMEDVFEDIRKETPELLHEGDDGSKKHVRKCVNKTAQNLIRSNFLNIIDGNF